MQAKRQQLGKVRVCKRMMRSTQNDSETMRKHLTRLPTIIHAPKTATITITACANDAATCMERREDACAYVGVK